MAPVAHHPTTSTNPVNSYIRQFFDLYSSVEHSTDDYRNIINKTSWITRRAIDSCLFCKSSVEANPSPRCRHSDNNWSYPGSAVGLGQCRPIQDLHRVPGQLCADLDPVPGRI